MAAQLNINTEKIEKIKTQVQNINDTVNTQATTISEIAALLGGKSASADTCTVTVTGCYHVVYTGLEGGEYDRNGVKGHKF